MPWYQKNPRPEDSASRKPSLESSDESRAHQDQLDVRPQSCPSQVRLQKELFHTVADLDAVSGPYAVPPWGGAFSAASALRRHALWREPRERRSAGRHGAI